MKPDVILTWPVHADYPLWRAQLHKMRSRLGEVLVVLSEHHVGEDLTEFLTEVLARDDVTILTAPARRNEDWRDTAVNAALDRSSAEWVWFTEQDFFIKDTTVFWNELERRAPLTPVLGVQDTEERVLHPCCLLTRRGLVEMTSRYFGSDPVDHFYTFTEELLMNTPAWGKISPLRWTHLAGLTQNHNLLDARRPDSEIYHPAELRAYLIACLESSEKLHPSWQAQAEEFVHTEYS